MRKNITLFLSLLATLFLSTSAFGQVFFTEDFEGTMDSTTNLPTGWTESTLSTDGGWNTGTTASASTTYLTFPVPTNDSTFAFTNDDGCNCDKSADLMILPVQNFTTYNAISLSFDLYLNGGYGEAGYVLASTNGGMNWDTLYTAVGNATNWQDGIAVNLTPYAGAAAVTVAFAYSDGTAWAYGMAIDDVMMTQLASAEDLESISATSEYTKIPLGQVTAMDLGATITNNGITNATDAVVTTHVLSSSNGFSTPLQTTMSSNTAVNTGDTVTVSSGTFTPMAAAVYRFQHIVSSALLVDGLPSNDTVVYEFEVTNGTYARDDSLISIGLGINGTGNTSTLGVNYTYNTATVIGSVTFGLNGVLTGDTTEIVIYNTDSTGMPTTPIDSVLYIMQNDGPTVETALFLPGVALSPGEYFFGVKEFVSVDNAGLMGTDNIFTPNTGWGSVNGGAYASIESLNFNVTFLIRPNMAPPCNNSTSTASVSICDGDVYTIGNSSYTMAGTYVDTLLAPGGCDSVVTTNLTVNQTPTASLMGLATDYCTVDSGVSLTGMPVGGTFSGPGMNGNIFDPNIAGTGTHNIVYTYTDTTTNCSASDTMTTMVSVCLGLEAGLDAVRITPNPNNGQFKLSGLHPGMEYAIFDLQGKAVYRRTAEFSAEAVQLQDRAAGLYFLQLNFEGASKQMKIVVE